MKKLFVLFLALSAAVFTSCSKDDKDEVKPEPSIVGVWAWESMIHPEGDKMPADDEVYIEFLEDNTFNEIILEKEDSDVYVESYRFGDYAFFNNKLINTTPIIFGAALSSTVKFIDNDNIELVCTNGPAKGYTFFLKRSAVKLAPYIEEYNSYVY